MAVQHRTRLTKGITGGLPNVDGDNFRPSDYLIDKLFLQGKEGDLASVMVRAPSIISGLVVSQGVGDTLNITAGSALAFDEQYASVTAHNYDGTALAPAVAIPAYPSVVKNEALTNLAIPSATLNGVAVNYVKALIAEDPVLQRGSEITPAPPYDFLTREILAITVDTVAPTANELVLAAFTGVSAGTFTFSSNPDSGQRSYPFGIATDTALVSSAGLEYWGFKVSGTLSRTIFKFRNQLNVSDPLFLTVLQDTTTGGSEKSAIAFTRGDYYGAGGETPLLTIGRKNTLVEDSIEHEVTPISRTTAPALGLLGAADGGKWIHRLLSDALDFMGDNAVSVQTLGTGDVTYKGRTYKPKARLTQTGDFSIAGKHVFRSGTGFDLTIQHAISANRTQTHQDRDGILALLDDVSASLNRGYIFGLTTANDAFDPANDLDISTGECVSDNGVLLRLSTILVKQLDANWVAGTNQGMLDSGTIAPNTTYHIFLIANLPLATYDIIASVSPTTPSLPAGFTEQRRIASIMTDGSSAIIPYTQKGDMFIFKDNQLSIPSVDVSTSGALYALSGPIGIEHIAIGVIASGLATTSNNLAIWIGAAQSNYPVITNSPPSNSSFIGITASSYGGGYLYAGSSYFQARTDTLGQVKMIRSSGTSYNSGGEQTSVQMTAWIDRRGQDG